MKLMVEGKMRNGAYFVPIEGHKKGGWSVGIAVEDMPHYFQTDWLWDCSYETAVELATARNERAGITPEEAERIIDTSVTASMRGTIGAL